MEPDSDFEELLRHISIALVDNTEKLDELKYLGRSFFDNPEETETLAQCSTGKEVLDFFKRREIISKNDVSKLKHVFEDIGGCSRYLNMLNRYTEKAQTIRSAKGMAMWQELVPNFIKTSTCEKVKECVERENLAILIGPSAAGKSQNCCWYADHFRSKETHTAYKLRCTNEDDLLRSLKGFLEYSKMEFEREEEPKSDYIENMAKVATSLIESGHKNGEQYLFIFDDVTVDTCKCVEKIIHSFHPIRNVKMLCSTSYSKFYEQSTVNDVFVKVEGVSESEAVKFFSEDVKKKNNEDDIKALASKMGYLPYGLVLANSYLSTTNMPLQTYIEKLSDKEFLKQVERVIRGTWQEYGKGLVSAQMLILEKVEETSSEDLRPLLRYIPFLRHNEMPTRLLKKLLPDSMDDCDKDTVVFDLITNIQEYCISGEIRSEHQAQVISIHAVTALVLELRLSREEKNSAIRDLLYFFCKNMSIDCRLHLTLCSNLEYQPHATKIILRATKTDLKKEKACVLLICVIHAAIGVTFRVSGVEHLLAEEHLNKAKTLCFQLIDYPDLDSLMLTAEEIETLDSMEYIDENMKQMSRSDSILQDFLRLFSIQEKNKKNGNEVESETVNHQQNARMKDSKTKKLFQDLIGVAKGLPKDLMPSIVIQTERTINDLEHLEEIVGFSGDEKHVDERQRGRLSNELYKKLLDKRMAMPQNKLGEVAVVELMVIILYNSGRAHYYQSKSHHQLTLICWNELRLAYLLGNLLRERYPEFPSVQSLITRRNGILYHCLVSRKHINESGKEKDVSLHKIICKYEEMLNAEDARYYEYGIIKVSKYQHLHHDAMCLKLILKCYITRIANADSKQDKECHFQEGKKHALKLETLLDDRHMCEWLAVPGFHVQVARFFLNHDLDKAEKHFKIAVDLENKYDLQRLSHFNLQGQFGLIDCFIGHDTLSSLEKAKITCEKLVMSLRESNLRRSYQKAADYLREINELITRKRHVESDD